MIMELIARKCYSENMIMWIDYLNLIIYCFISSHAYAFLK